MLASIAWCFFLPSLGGWTIRCDPGQRLPVGKVRRWPGRNGSNNTVRFLRSLLPPWPLSCPPLLLVPAKLSICHGRSIIAVAIHACTIVDGTRRRWLQAGSFSLACTDESGSGIGWPRPPDRLPFRPACPRFGFLLRPLLAVACPDLREGYHVSARLSVDPPSYATLTVSNVSNQRWRGQGNGQSQILAPMQTAGSRKRFLLTKSREVKPTLGATAN